MAAPETPGTPDSDRRTLPHLGLKLRLARWALLWEGLWPALLPAGLLAGCFLILALLDLLPLLGPWLHSLVLLLFAGGFLWLVRRELRAFRWPGEDAARRRLERSSRLRHRPLVALNDTPAGSQGEEANPTLAAYWALHRQRLRSQLRKLRVGWPQAGWSRRDGYGLRVLVGIPLLLALVHAGESWDTRLLRAAIPGMMLDRKADSPNVEAWISPPSYTGEAPLYLRQDEALEEPIRVPAGSRLLAQVQGGHGTPSLALDGEAAQPFDLADEEVYRTEIELPEAKRLSILQNGLPLAGWPLQVIPDRPPTAEYLSPPTPTARGALQFEYAVSDDYGVESLAVLIERRDPKGEGDVMTLPLALPERSAREGEGRSFHDLTPHPWAGIPVRVTLEARDGLDQAGRSDTVEMELPERRFTHPVAKRLVDLRRALTLNPDAREPVAEALDRLARNPQRFGEDVVVLLGILTAEQRLLQDRRQDAVAPAQSLLWNLALHIEEGDLAIAERQLRELQQQLQEALAENAPQEEIDRLLNELQQAMDRFLQSMIEQAMQEGLNAQEQGETPFDAENLTRSDLQEMLEEARELARSGARDEALQRLSQLQQMLENLQARRMPSPESQQQLQQSREMMQNLQDIMRRQQELLDRSFQRAQRGDLPEGRGEDSNSEGEREGSPGAAPGSAAGDSSSQEELRRRLNELMRQAGERSGGTPGALGQAERAMAAAREALERGLSRQALGPQGESLDHLQRGMEALLEDFAEQLGEGQGGEGNAFGSPGGERDPFGRRRGEGGYLDRGDGFEVPDETTLQRAREILNELRRRSSERDRPQIELDYLERLLRQF